jgi:hypothetical protein
VGHTPYQTYKANLKEKKEEEEAGRRAGNKGKRKCQRDPRDI